MLRSEHPDLLASEHSLLDERSLFSRHLAADARAGDDFAGACLALVSDALSLAVRSVEPVLDGRVRQRSARLELKVFRIDG
jgi:hypothetical protein